MLPPQAPADATDIFSLSDQVLGDRLQFIEEIGFGNWGSVWLCRPKTSGSSKHTKDDVKLAVKLVHRSKTTTTAARVRSLWNEMKIVRTFKNDPHPSIVPFHSFIITPSYALITMDFLPTLVPVDVPEPKAKEWFRSLLSGILFLHKRGVVHNDIKPANILLSYAGVPVLVDFGFAEKYDMKIARAFHSNLTYGTPEYLSPERARGLPHDTRKSDVWSLGITFFEILIGRTPFEYEEGEQFTTKEDLEKYWARTMRGKWVGTWAMSKGVERLLKRMVQPNADLRCTASDAMADAYWAASATSTVSGAHKKAASVSSPDASKILDIISPWATRRLSRDLKAKAKPTTKLDKENITSRTTTTTTTLAPKVKKEKELPARPGHARSQSQIPPETVDTKKRVASPGLAPIRGSPSSTALDASARVARKENVTPGKENAERKPFGARKPVPRVESRGDLVLGARRRALADRTNATKRAEAGAEAKEVVRERKVKVVDQENANAPVVGQENIKPKEAGANVSQEEGKSMGSVRDRMREWERERERLREMERVKEREGDVTEDENKPAEAVVEAPRKREEAQREQRDDTEGVFGNGRNAMCMPLSPVGSSMPSTPMSPDMQSFFGDSFPRSVSQSFNPVNSSGLGIFKHSLKMSIDRTLQMYKSSTMGLVGKLGSQSPSASPEDISGRQSWEDEEFIKEANSSLPVVRNAVRNAQVGADSRADRMTIWIQNVEKVVEDARQNFASSSVAHLPPLPIAPVTRTALHKRSNSQNRSNRSSRLPRKILAASQIFAASGEQSFVDQSFVSSALSASQNSQTPVPDHTLPVIPSEEPTRATVSMDSPLRMRRATVYGRSPEKSLSLDIEMGSPSKRKEKSKSQNDLQRAISPVSKLTFELERLAQPSPPMRLSAVIDRSLFIAEPNHAKLEAPVTPSIRVSEEDSRARTGHDSLTSSPFVVQPYPSRERAAASPTVDSPTQRRIEGVYDRFLMATTGVKRLGRGYQSDNIGPVGNVPEKTVQAPRIFHSTRRVMPPPVSSEDQRKTLSVDELGVMHSSPAAVDTPSAAERTSAVRGVRKAIKAIVTGKTVVKKHVWV